MVDIDPLFELVQLVTDFLPIIIVIAVVLFLMTLIFKLLPTKGALTSKLRIDKKMIIAMLGMTLMVLTPIMAANGAVGISVDSSVTFGGTVMTVKATGLTADQEYTIWASGNSQSFTNVTFTASESTEFIPLPVLDDADGYTLSVGTSTSGVASSAAATLYVSPRDIGDFLPIDFFFNLLVPMILIAVVVGVAVGFVGKSNRG